MSLPTRKPKLVTKKYLEKHLKVRADYITDGAVQIINDSMNEPEFQGTSLIDDAITYQNIIQGTRYTTEEYLQALKFVAYISTQRTNITEAYVRIFHHREFVQKRMNLPTSDPKYTDLTSAACRYKRSKLVQQILTATQIPLDMMFAGERYRAVGVLADRMINARLDKDKINAAKELLANTKGPENVKLELDIGTNESSQVQQLNDQLASLASSAMEHLKAGTMSIDELGAMKVKTQEELNAVEAEFEEVDE